MKKEIINKRLKRETNSRVVGLYVLLGGGGATPTGTDKSCGARERMDLKERERSHPARS